MDVKLSKKIVSNNAHTILRNCMAISGGQVGLAGKPDVHSWLHEICIEPEKPQTRGPKTFILLQVLGRESHFRCKTQWCCDVGSRVAPVRHGLLKLLITWVLSCFTGYVQKQKSEEEQRREKRKQKEKQWHNKGSSIIVFYYGFEDFSKLEHKFLNRSNPMKTSLSQTVQKSL